ncbi:MAG: Crp/Fnr family transcriptional regulator [Pirellulales bacterium]
MMADYAIPLAALGDCALLVDLNDEERGLVLAAMTVGSFATDEVLLQQGIVTHNVWLLLEGRCEVVKEPPSGQLAKAVTLAEITPYETFGEMTLFCDAPHCTSVWAKTDVKTIKLSRVGFDRLAERRPAITYRLACNLVNILGERLRRMDQWLTGLLDEHDGAVVEEQWERIGQRLQKTCHGYVF